jgi:DNA-binding LacI/PurR family transcriptional regulator
VDRLLAQNRLPEAAVAASSNVALGILVALRRHGLSPEDIALASVDDIESASMIEPFSDGRRAAGLRDRPHCDGRCCSSA